LRNEEECDLPIDDSFPGDHIFALPVSNVSGFMDLVSYLACGIVPSDMNFHQRKRFFSQAKSYFWEEPVYTRLVEMGLFGNVCPERGLLSLFPIATICLVVHM